MSNLHNSIRTVENVHANAIRAAERAQGAPPLSEAQARESNAARIKAMTTLSSTIALVNETIRENDVTYATIKEHEPVMRAALASVDVSSGPTASATETVNRVADLATSDKIRETMPTLIEMADGIEPILRRFDVVLSKPYLRSHNASLNTAPVVGIKDKQVWYVDTKADSDGVTESDWLKFCDLPHEAEALPNKNYIIFPYNGDFCLSIGRAVWKKEQRTAQEDRKKAVNNWPLLYKDWVKVGDTILPTDDIKGIIPYVALNPKTSEAVVYLVVLNSDSSLTFMGGNDLTNLTVKPLKLKPAASPSEAQPAVLKWSRIAYWNAQIVAFDDANCMYDVHPDFQTGEYTYSNKTTEEPILGVTADESNVIAARSDGYLWRNLITLSEDSKASTKWQKWIKHKDMTHIGVASPGVMVDMHLLTSILRARYVNAQVSFYHVISKIRSFTGVHTAYVKSLKAASAKYKGMTDYESKREFAIDQGETFADHTAYWSGVVETALAKCYTQVADMSKQVESVYADLRNQLKQLKVKLDGLEKYLKSQEETMTKLEVGFWISVVVAIVGAVVAVAGLYFGNMTVAKLGGAIFAAGLAAAVIIGKKKAELSTSISETKAAIADVSTAHKQLKEITEDYKNLSGMHKTLTAFWGRLFTDAKEIRDKDTAIVEMMGERLLRETHFTYQDVIDATDAIRDVCNKYLDVLHKQGIEIPAEPPRRSRVAVSYNAPVSYSAVSYNAPAELSMGDSMPGEALNFVATGSDSIVFEDPITFEDATVVENVTEDTSFKEYDSEFFRLVDEAKSKLDAFDVHGYNATMKLAVLAVVA